MASGTAASTARPSQLDVYFGDALVGALLDASPLAFAYAPAWLQRADGFPIAAIPLQTTPVATPAVAAFFENLLPEGELRQYIAEQNKASTLFSLLLAVAGDTAGGFTILPGGQQPGPARYQATSWPALAAQLGTRSAAAITLQGEGARISLAGAQDKTGIAIFADGQPQLPLGTAPSTHILKPNIRRLAKVWHSAANETITMLAAAHCGLPTAEVFYQPDTQACVVRRFDRVARADGSLARRVQYDLCQLAGTVSEKKYEKEGGPGIVLCAELVRRYSTQPAVDLRHLVLWIFFNLYVGNNDSHAKNLSVYQAPGGGVGLAPFYDLMCTRLYPGLSPEFAFAIGGETLPGAVQRSHIDALAAHLRMRPQFLQQQAAALAQKLPAAMEQAVATVLPAVPPGARAMVERLHKFVLTTTRHTAARLAR